MNEKELAANYEGVKGRTPRTLYIDIETSYAVGTFWGGRMWKVDILDVVQESMPIMVGYMWQGDKKARSFCLKDFKGYKPGLFNINDKELIEKAWPLLNEADLVIGQNSQSFDVRILMARFWHYGMPPPAGFAQEDTKRNAKKVFYLSSYKLSNMTKFRGIRQKIDPGGKRAWDDVLLHGRGWEEMSKYCRNDVEITKELHESMSGYIKPKLTANLITRRTDHCPNPTCMSKKIIKYGKRPLKTGWKQRWVCQMCSTQWVTELNREDAKVDVTLV